MKRMNNIVCGIVWSSMILSLHGMHEVNMPEYKDTFNIRQERDSIQKVGTVPRAVTVEHQASSHNPEVTQAVKSLQQEYPRANPHDIEKFAQYVHKYELIHSGVLSRPRDAREITNFKPDYTPELPMTPEQHEIQALFEKMTQVMWKDSLWANLGSKAYSWLPGTSGTRQTENVVSPASTPETSVSLNMKPVDSASPDVAREMNSLGYGRDMYNQSVPQSAFPLFEQSSTLNVSRPSSGALDSLSQSPELSRPLSMESGRRNNPITLEELERGKRNLKATKQPDLEQNRSSFEQKEPEFTSSSRSEGSRYSESEFIDAVPDVVSRIIGNTLGVGKMTSFVGSISPESAKSMLNSIYTTVIKALPRRDISQGQRESIDQAMSENERRISDVGADQTGTPETRMAKYTRILNDFAMTVYRILTLQGSGKSPAGQAQVDALVIFNEEA